MSCWQDASFGCFFERDLYSHHYRENYQIFALFDLAPFSRDSVMMQKNLKVSN